MFLCRSIVSYIRTPVTLKVGENVTNLCNLNKRMVATGLGNHQKRGFLLLGVVGGLIGVGVGTGYSVYKSNAPRGHIMNEETNIPVVREAPSIKPTKKIRIAGDQSGLKLSLYQYQTCPFCCKVRAFLDYYGVSYDVIEVDPVLRQSIKWSQYKKVPILLAQTQEGYQPLNDSSMIVSAIASYLHDSTRDLTEIAKYYPFISFIEENGGTKKEIMNKYFIMIHQQETKNLTVEEVNEERKWRKWADDVLVHTLSPNVYRTREEALQAFNWFSDVGEWEKNFPAWERYLIIYVGAFAMWMIGKKLKKRHNLKDDVRESLYDECNIWIRAVKAKGTSFMGGNQPNLADLAVYGILSSIEGCYAFQDLLHESKIKPWYFAMKNVVNSHQGSSFT